ncbi:hypothetical protein DYB38_014056 [Aphanomyces astaci]|uniref:Uncharacterized protein n=1 Tax=Aphanomyces astaci TaxID=112090 RepID=A0A397E4Z9_APHAT|nr:hypothetical protein DYB38_014056 [Aphanomyces astaci]
MATSHRFNLFVSDMLTNHATVIDKDNALMTKPSSSCDPPTCDYTKCDTLEFDVQHVETRASCQKPNFESAIVKILRGTETTMTAEERESVIKLRNEETIESSTAAVALPVMSLAERALKKKKVTRVTSGFMYCRFLCPSSTCVSASFRLPSWPSEIDVAA